MSWSLLSNYLTFCTYAQRSWKNISLTFKANEKVFICISLYYTYKILAKCSFEQILLSGFKSGCRVGNEIYNMVYIQITVMGTVVISRSANVGWLTTHPSSWPLSTGLKTWWRVDNVTKLPWKWRFMSLKNTLSLYWVSYMIKCFYSISMIVFRHYYNYHNINYWTKSYVLKNYGVQS